MKNIYIILILLFFTTNSFANSEENVNPSATASVNGHIVLKNSGENLPFMTVLIKGTTIGTAGDASGRFLLKNIPTGKHTIRIQGIGYKSVEQDIELKEGKTIDLTFEMEEDAFLLDGVVVTANRNETDRRVAPIVINVLSPKLFEATNSISLAQGLNFQPGLRVENNCQNCGFQQVRINGLDGPYSQILIDSRPLCSSLAGVYGLEQIPANMVERVEVMRGGGSALFGANAIAGTVNIITKEPLHNTFQISHVLSAIDGKNFDNATSINGAIVSDSRDAGIHLFGMIRDRQPYDNDNDGFSELGKISSRTVGFRSYYKPSHFSKLTLEYHHMNEFRRGGDRINRPPHEAEVAEETDHNIHGGGLNYTLNSRDYNRRLELYTSIQNIGRESYYGTGQNLDAYGHTKDITIVAGTQYGQQFKNLLFMPAELTTGFEYSYNKLNDEMLGYEREIKQDISIYSLFLQNEWKNEHFSFLLGGRMDKNTILDNPIFSPRANIRYNPVEDLSLRLSYSEGFRAPQTYDEDLHVAAVGGEVAIIQLDKNLKTERSRSISGSIDYYRSFGSVEVNLLVEGFYTHLRNIFVLDDIGTDDSGNKILERRNGSSANVQGVNIEGRVAPHRSFQLQFGGTFQNSRYKEAHAWSSDPEAESSKRILRSPDIYGYLTAELKPFKNMSASLSGTYTGPMYIGHYAGYIKHDILEKSSSFFDVALKLAYDLRFKNGYTVQLNGGIQNMFNSYQDDFDKGPDRDSGYIYGPGLPRTWFLGLKFGIF